MKTFSSKLFLIITIAGAYSFSKGYYCFNQTDKVSLSISFTSADKATVNVLTPFKKNMDCVVAEYDTHGKLATGYGIKGFVCGSNEIPDVVAVNEKTLTGMLDLFDKPTYNNLSCNVIQ